MPVIRGQAKAAGINSAMEIARRMAGAEAHAAFVESLPAPLAEVIRRPPVATSWISLELTVPLWDALLKDLFQGDPARLVELGRLQFREDLSSVYRLFMRVASPTYVAGRLTMMWTTYTRDCGTAAVVVSEEKMGELQFDDYPMPNPPIWYYLQGAITGVLELTGVKGLTVRMVAGGPGRTFCRYRVAWS